MLQLQEFHPIRCAVDARTFVRFSDEEGLDPKWFTREVLKAVEAVSNPSLFPPTTTIPDNTSSSEQHHRYGLMLIARCSRHVENPFLKVAIEHFRSAEVKAQEEEMQDATPPTARRSAAFKFLQSYAPSLQAACVDSFWANY